MYSSYHLLIDTFFAMLPRYWSFCCKFRAKFRIAVSLPKFALNFVFTWNNGYVGSAKNTHTIYVPGWQTIKAYGSMNIYTYCIHTHVVAWDLCKLLRMWFDLLVWSCQHHGLTSQCLILLWWIRKGSGCLGSLASTSPLDKLWKPHAVKSFLPSSLHMSAPFLGHELASDFLPQPKPINFLKFVLQFRPPQKKRPSRAKWPFLGLRCSAKSLQRDTASPPQTGAKLRKALAHLQPRPRLQIDKNVPDTTMFQQNRGIEWRKQDL